MADTRVSQLPDGETAEATDRIPAARPPFGDDGTVYITPNYIADFVADSLADVASTGSYNDLTNVPAFGTAALLNVGTADGNVVQVQSGGKLPVLDGSDLTNLPIASVPTGGSEGQVLTKLSGDDFDFQWDTPPGGGDMLASVYDPNGLEADAFDMDNMVEGATTKIMTATERTKLSGIASGATANSADATLLARANHTGTQTLSTISDAGTLAGLSSINNSNWSGTDLAIANGGTGASDAATARTNLGLAIGSDVQAYDAELAAIAGLTSAADRVPYFTGSGTAALATFTSTARNLLDDTSVSAMRTTLGVAVGSDVQAYSALLAAIAGLTPTDGNIIVGDGTTFVAESGSTARASLGLGSLATASSINNGNWSGTDLAVANGGTGASDAATARTNLGVAINSDVQAYNASLAAIAALAVTDGNFIVGNGTTFVAESGATARSSLGLGTLATASSINNANWSGTDLAVANGGTGGSDATTARTNLGAAASATTISTTAPLSGGGNLTANRTLTLTMASQAEAEAGTATNVAMNPLRTAQAIAALSTSATTQTFNSSGTWTKPSTGTMAFIEAWGAGGSGARNSTASSAGAGGGGAYIWLWMPLSALPSSVTVTVGAGGASRTGSNQAGADGGSSTFGSYLTAYGGKAGPSASGASSRTGGGAGPLGTGTDTGNDMGQPDHLVASVINTSVFYETQWFHGGGAGGGNSIFGGGGGGHATGSTTAGGTSIAGGNGGAGGATGTAGAQPGGGGGAGTSTSGAGGAGRVRVTVF